nr:uncharacterized protein LOC132763874 [Anolis sagrei ordinatus]
MWKELDERVRKSLQEIHSTQKQGAQAPLVVSSSRRAQESVDANNLCGKTGESLMEEAGKFPQKKQLVPDAEKTGVTTDKDLHFRREYPINSTLTDAGPKETEGYLLKEEQDTGLMKNSKEERLCSSMDTALQCSHPVTPSDKLYGFSLDLEKPRLESGFHTARAVLINISGSSPSSLEEEEEDQDTDISLPEEFIIQDEMFCGTPTVPRIGINTSPSSGGRSHTQIYGGPSNQVDLSRLCSQEGKPSSEKINRSAFIILSSDGSPRSNSIGMERSHSGQADVVVIGRDVSSLKDSKLEKMAFQEDAKSEDVSCSDNPKDPKKQQIGSIVEGEDDHENPTCSKLVASKVSLKDVRPIDGEMQVFSSESQNPSDQLLILDNSKGHAEYSIGESNLYEDPTSNGSLCPQIMEGTTEEDQNCPTASSQSSMRSRVVSSSKDEERSEDDNILVSEEHPPGIEEEIVSPLDEVLSRASVRFR